MTKLRPIWPVLTLLFSGAMLAGAHAFQRVGGLQPCPLCLDQREWHWGVVGVSLAMLALVRFRPAWGAWAAGVIALPLLGATAQALFHVAVENHWVVYQCAAGGPLDANSLDFNALVEANRPVTIPACDEVLWSMFGISMAGYNAILSGLASLASLAVAFWPERRS